MRASHEQERQLPGPDGPPDPSVGPVISDRAAEAMCRRSCVSADARLLVVNAEADSACCANVPVFGG
jgi:hypothetical protein